MDVPPKKVPYFKPGKELKELINDGRLTWAQVGGFTKNEMDGAYACAAKYAEMGQVMEALQSGAVGDYQDAKYSNVKFLTEAGTLPLEMTGLIEMGYSLAFHRLLAADPVEGAAHLGLYNVYFIHYPNNPPVARFRQCALDFRPMKRVV